MKRILRLLLYAAIVVGLAAGGYWLYQTRFASQPSAQAATALTQVVTVRQGNLATSITVVGELDAEQLQALTFSRLKATTKLKTLDVKAGNTVKAGQVLATIDAAAYQQARDQAKSALQAAEEALADLRTPATKLQIAKADLAVAKAELQLQQAQENLTDLQEPDIAALRTAVADAQRSLAQAEVNLATVLADTSYETNMTKLLDKEADASAQYSRLATESTPASDAGYQDRLRLALNALKNAEDNRITTEVQRQQNILNAQIKVSTGKQALAKAQEALATAEAGTDELALAKAKVAVQEAEVALSTAKDNRTALDEGPDATDLAAAQADVDKKRLALTEAEADLAACSLVAPFDGTILQVRTTAGSNIASSSSILTVADMKSLQVVANVDETTIQRVKVGQDAVMTFDAVSGRSFRGKVLSVPLDGALQNNTMVYEVPISLTGAENVSLLVGMTANVRLQVAQAENALLIPALAVKQVGREYQVLVPNTDDPAGQPKAVPVEVGLSDGTNIQITKGLNVGDKVVVQFTIGTTTTTTQQPGMGAGMGGQPFIIEGGGGGGQFVVPGGGGGMQPPGR